MPEGDTIFRSARTLHQALSGATVTGFETAYAPLAAVHDNKPYFGREHGAVDVTLPLRDRNGEIIGAMRVKMKHYFGETQDSALTQAFDIRRSVEALFMPYARNTFEFVEDVSAMIKHDPFDDGNVSRKVQLL